MSRFKRVGKFSLPSIGVIFARLAQFLVLIALSNLTNGETRDVLVAGFGLLASFSIVSDAGAANYLLATAGASTTRRTYDRVVILQFVVGVIGSVAALSFIERSAGDSFSAVASMVLVSIAISQIVDGCLRAVRAPLLVRGADHSYGFADLVLAITKAPLITAAFAFGNAGILVGLPVASLIVAVPVFFMVRRQLQVDGPRPARLVFRVLEFGITGGLSAFYSQSPMIVGSLFLPTAQLAVLATVYRTVQPLEMVPSMISQQLMPRMRRSNRRLAAYWAPFAALGAVAMLVMLFARPLIEWVLGSAFTPVSVFVVVVISMTPKFGNYALVAFLMGTGRIRQRLIITLVVGITALIAAFGAGLSMNVVTLSCVTLGSEILLTALIFGSRLHRNRQGQDEGSPGIRGSINPAWNRQQPR